jgi:hypothetical protein
VVVEVDQQTTLQDLLEVVELETVVVQIKMVKKVLQIQVVEVVDQGQQMVVLKVEELVEKELLY